jgi:hypothetical protein
VRELFENNYPVDGLGNIHLVDSHGGATASTTGYLVGLFPIQLPGEQFAISTKVYIYFAWNRPAYFFGWGDALPSDVVPVILRHRYGPSFPSYLTIYPSVRIVHFNTADVPWASRGAVDAGDLSAITAYLGRRAC